MAHRDGKGHRSIARFSATKKANSLADEIKEVARGSLASFEVPKHVFSVDDLPGNGAGKLLERELRETFADKN